MILLIRLRDFGLHSIIRESRTCYYYKNKHGYVEGVLKRKWYVIRISRKSTSLVKKDSQ